VEVAELLPRVLAIEATDFWSFSDGIFGIIVPGSYWCVLCATSAVELEE